MRTRGACMTIESKSATLGGDVFHHAHAAVAAVWAWSAATGVSACLVSPADCSGDSVEAACDADSLVAEEGASTLVGFSVDAASAGGVPVSPADCSADFGTESESDGADSGGTVVVAFA